LSKILACLFLATVIIHLCWGIYFFTKASNNAPKTSLKLTGEAFLASQPGWNTENERDASAYNRAAHEIQRAGVPRSREGVFFDHAPAYAYFLAACYWVGGVRLLSIALPQAILSGLIGFLLALAAWRLAPRNKAAAAMIASGLILISVRIATYVGYINPACLLLCLFCAAFLAAGQPPSLRMTVIFAVAMVLGTYTMASFFLVGMASAFWLGLQFWRHRRRLDLICAVVILAAGVGPKVAFSMSSGDSIRVATKAQLWDCNNPYYDNWGWWSLWDIIYGQNGGPPSPAWKLSDAQLRRYDEYLARTGGDAYKAGFLWVRENPLPYTKLCFIRLRAVLGPVTARMKLPNRILSTAWWLLVFPAGFYGLWKHRKWPISVLAMLIILILVASETLIMAGLQPRYRLPMDLMLVVYAGLVYAPLAARWAGYLGIGANRSTALVPETNP